MILISMHGLQNSKLPQRKGKLSTQQDTSDFLGLGIFAFFKLFTTQIFVFSLVKIEEDKIHRGVLTLPLQMLAYAAIHSFGIRLIYPGSIGLIQTLLGNQTIKLSKILIIKLFFFRFQMQIQFKVGLDQLKSLMEPDLSQKLKIRIQQIRCLLIIEIKPQRGVFCLYVPKEMLDFMKLELWLHQQKLDILRWGGIIPVLPVVRYDCYFKISSQF